MSSVKIEALKSSLSSEVIEVLARAYLTNPIHIAMFGGSGDQELRLGRDLFIAMNQFICTGQWYAAISENQILGCFHMARFPRCRASKEQLKEMGARLVKTLGEFSTRVAISGSDWGKRDPEKDHGHFGPIGVLPEYQKKGIGRLYDGTFLRYCG